MNRVLFFARVRDRSLLGTLDFYRQDIDALTSVGYDVVVATTIRQALLSRVDAYFCWWFHLSAPVVMWARLRGKPVIVTGATHFRDPERPTLLRRALGRVLTRIAGRLATLAVPVSEYEAADLETVGVRRITVCHHSARGVELATPAQDFGGSPIATTIGQINPRSIDRKGIGLVVQAAREVARTHPDFRLHVIGPASDEGAAELNRLIGGDPAIVVEGLVSEARKYALLSRSWFYLQPSSYEGFGVAVAEALASGAVPMVTREGALPEVVGDAGIFVTRDVSDVAGKLLSAIAEPDGLADARDRALERGRLYAPAAKVSRVAALLAQAGFPAVDGATNHVASSVSWDDRAAAR